MSESHTIDDSTTHCLQSHLTYQRSNETLKTETKFALHSDISINLQFTQLEEPMSSIILDTFRLHMSTHAIVHTLSAKCAKVFESHVAVINSTIRIFEA